MAHTNNFHLIRLFAAFQVFYFHAAEHLSLTYLNVEHNLFSKLFYEFPGVPIFFFISGFLIYQSYKNSSTLKSYAQKRALRIAPALITCCTFTLILLIALNVITGFTPSVFIWYILQIGILPIYNPEIFRDFGSGMPNGSLWSIPVEIQFYVIVPLIFTVTCYARKTFEQFKEVYSVLALALFSYLIYEYDLSHERSSLIAQVLLGNGLFAYFWFFSIGIITNIYWNNLRKYVEGKFLVWVSIYLSFIFMNDSLEISHYTNLLKYALLAMCTLSAAYTSINLTKRTIGNEDISYGFYLYHMPVINTLIYFNITESTQSFFIGLAFTTFLAFASWTLLEKPCIKRKPKQNNQKQKCLET